MEHIGGRTGFQMIDLHFFQRSFERFLVFSSITAYESTSRIISYVTYQKHDWQHTRSSILFLSSFYLSLAVKSSLF